MSGQIVANYILSGTMSADRINGGTLILGGYDNVDGLLKVLDSSGNTLVQADRNGITLANGAKLIGGNGVLSNFKYDAVGTYNEFLGFYPDEVNQEYKKIQFKINAYLPEKFTVSEAKVTIIHAPVSYVDLKNNAFWGYSRNVKLYKVSNKNFVRLAYIGSEYYDIINPADLNEITGAFGSNGFTANAPSTNNHVVQTATSIDVKDSLETGNNTLVIQTDATTPAFSDDGICKEGWIRTGQAQAVLNIVGYMK